MNRQWMLWVVSLSLSGVCSANPPVGLKLGESYTENSLDNLFSQNINSNQTIFVRTSGPHFSQRVDNDIYLIEDLEVKDNKRLGQLVGMVRPLSGGIAFKKNLACVYDDNLKSKENNETYRVFECSLVDNPRAAGGKPMNVIYTEGGVIYK